MIPREIEGKARKLDVVGVLFLPFPSISCHFLRLPADSWQFLLIPGVSLANARKSYVETDFCPIQPPKDETIYTHPSEVPQVHFSPLPGAESMASTRDGCEEVGRK
jgi:hypothetical protein